MKKFFAVIGNPPYQDQAIGDNKSFAPPLYNSFLDEAYKVSDRVEMIHPARFLFNAGRTPKEWNRKMLNDSHFKVLYYEPDCEKVFPGTEIKGGLAVSYRDTNHEYGPIGIFTPYPELNSIMRKAAPMQESDSLMAAIFVQNKFDLDSLYADYPESRNAIGSSGKDKRFRNNIFEKIAAFNENRTGDNEYAILGVVKNKRQWRYIRATYVDDTHENLNKWKVLVVRVNGRGEFGELLSSPIIAKPGEGYTQTFIGIGSLKSKEQAEAVLKYVESKFARAMLGILKITQDNNRETWRYVPLQDFTSASDIDWTQSVADIDRQLYAKYDLAPEEIEFIDTHVKEMD